MTRALSTKTVTPLSRRQFISTATAALPAGDLAFSQTSIQAGAHAVLDPNWATAGIIATRHCPYAKLKSVPVQAVTITEGFWSKRRQTNVEASIPSMRTDFDRARAHG